MSDYQKGFKPVEKEKLSKNFDGVSPEDMRKLKTMTRKQRQAAISKTKRELKNSTPRF